MATTGKTGIEVSPGISDAQKRADKILHALHLDWFGAVGTVISNGHPAASLQVKGTREG